MQADSDVDALVDRQPAVPLGHAALERGCTLHRIDHACELGQEAISHQLEDASVTLLDLRLEQLPAMRPQALERAHLILLHEPAVAGHVGSHDGGELAIHNSTTGGSMIKP